MIDCCEQMKRQVEFACAVHPDLGDCPDSLIVYQAGTREFGLRVHDGGGSFIAIRHCPWCGTNLLARASDGELGPLQMLRDLIAHKGYAVAAMLIAIRQTGTAASDPEIRDLLHHALIANRFWLLTVARGRFDHEAEARPFSSFDALIERYRTTHADETAWLEGATPSDLERVLMDARIPNGQCTVAQALTQVCLHSHGHRAQCAKLLRRLGGMPPATDFILWLTDRPAAVWSGGQPAD